jgi:hypothetical protein
MIVSLANAPPIRSLAFVIGRQRAIRIEFNNHIFDIPIHQISDYPANPYTGSPGDGCGNEHFRGCLGGLLFRFVLNKQAAKGD